MTHKRRVIGDRGATKHFPVLRAFKMKWKLVVETEALWKRHGKKPQMADFVYWYF